MNVGKRMSAGLVVSGLLLVASLPSHAATFGVRVIDESGKPVSGASVCIGLQGNHKQFGALFTNDEGIATTDVPNVPLMVTVSKTRFTGMRVQEPARGFNLIKDMTLIEGIPGPRCRADSALASAGGTPIKISDIDITASSWSTFLSTQATGEPTHYRVAADRNFEGAGWQNYVERIQLPQQLADATEVFLQLRRYSGSERASLESRSDITSIVLAR